MGSISPRRVRRPILPRAARGFVWAALSVVLLLTPGAVCSQEPSADELARSGIAGRNLSRVAAPAEEVIAVLRSNSGLLVELKRWVAQQASEQGQIVEDRDLSDVAVFARIEREIEFRALATRLLQRYGYLQPRFNPDSDVAKEQELLRQARVERLLRAQADDGETPEQKPAPSPTARQPSGSPRQSAAPSEAIRIPSPGKPDMWPAITPGMQVERVSLDSAAAPERVTGAPDASPVTNPAWDPWRSDAKSELTGETGSRRRRIGPRRTSAGSAAPAETLVRPNPYGDVPSLYDLYRQVRQTSGKLERFGMEVFRQGFRDLDALPMDLPVGPDYVVGPGDGLTVDLWGSVSARIARTVDREGRLTLPEVGPVLVSGQPLGQVQRTVEQLLRTQFRDVSADVSLTRLRTVRVYVVGDVAEAGAYDISSLSTPLNALFAAGGPTERGSVRTVRHLRGDRLIREVDLYDLLLRGVRSDLSRLENGDTVLVPPLGAQVRVEGAVRRPAVYELHGEETLASVLELAGGILPTAALRQIEVQRLDAHRKRTMLSLDFSAADSPEAMAAQMDAFPVRDGDEIRIFSIAPYNTEAVYLEGHVLRPGRYSFREGMRVTDLVAVYADLLPEPAARYAEIIRLGRPDFRPSVESFDLGAALANPEAAPLLEPLDTVRIFSRFDFEEVPTISVGGEVWNPGRHRATGQLHLRDALHLAGGLTPDAALEDAQVFRRQPDGQLRILSVNLRDALSGNPAENILLEPRDRIIVHRLPARVDPPTVYLRGEVAKPGRYPLTANMRLSDLLRLGGGLKRSAYPERADLTRYLAADAATAASEHTEIHLGHVLAGASEHDLPLRDGDVLTIRQIPGWDDRGASVKIAGEVAHPGEYGIRRGERLSSVLRRAGGLLPSAYPQGAVLLREEVRELQERSRQNLIQRIESQIGEVRVALSTSAQEQAALEQSAAAQRQRVLEALKRAPVSGRMVVTVYPDLDRFAGSVDDIEMRDGDRLVIPKSPDFVLVTGQVYNSNAINFTPRKKVGWYLRQAGGATDLADRGAIFIIRANGSVVSSGGSWWGGRSVTSVRIEPGDTIVVPERPLGESATWKNFLTVAQVTTQAAISAAILMR